jgi:hypothetical protein
MCLKHAILGILSFSPMTGYDLKKAFDRSVRHFWPVNQSQIYRTLAELDASTPLPPQGTREPLLMRVFFGRLVSDADPFKHP